MTIVGIRSQSLSFRKKTDVLLQSEVEIPLIFRSVNPTSINTERAKSQKENNICPKTKKSKPRIFANQTTYKNILFFLKNL